MCSPLGLVQIPDADTISVLQDTLLLARRLAFSPFGMQVTAAALSCPWSDKPAYPPLYRPLWTHYEVGTRSMCEAVEVFALSDFFDVILDDTIGGQFGLVREGSPQIIRLHPEPIALAVRARQAYGTGSTTAAMHLFFCATIVAHEIQHVCRRVVATCPPLTPPRVLTDHHTSRYYLAPDRRSVFELGEGGTYWSQVALGGTVFASVDRLLPTPSFFTGLFVQVRLGRFRINADDVLRFVVAGEGHRQLVPFKPGYNDVFVPRSWQPTVLRYRPPSAPSIDPDAVAHMQGGCGPLPEDDEDDWW